MKKAKRYSGSSPLQKCVKFKVDRLETLQKHSSSWKQKLAMVHHGMKEHQNNKSALLFSTAPKTTPK